MSQMTALPDFPEKEVERRIALLPKRLACVAFPVEGDRYRAICLDVSLVAESGSSLLDAQERLAAQIEDYIEDVVAAGCPPDLVHRDVGRLERIRLQILLATLAVRAWIANILPIGGDGDRAIWSQPVHSPR